MVLSHFCVAGFIYLILCAQTWGAALYAADDRERSFSELRSFALWGGVPIACFLLSAVTQSAILLVGFGLSSFWGGFVARRMVKNSPDEAHLMVLHNAMLVLLPITSRWPMLIFDVWTIGLTSLFLILTL